MNIAAASSLVSGIENNVDAGGPGSGRRPGFGWSSFENHEPTAKQQADANHMHDELLKRGFKESSSAYGDTKSYQHPTLGSASVHNQGYWSHASTGSYSPLAHPSEGSGAKSFDAHFKNVGTGKKRFGLFSADMKAGGPGSGNRTNHPSHGGSASDSITRAANRYIDYIPHDAKRAYAKAYHQWILEGRVKQNEPTWNSEHLSDMAAKAVRLNLEEFYDGVA